MNMDLNGLLEWRCIGPFRGGRVITVAGDVNNVGRFYFGACAGGVWKTEDAGTYWECITDGFLNTSSIGALAVSEVDPNVIYAGTGEATIRIDVSHGDGVYKSTDAGRTWKHVGLSDTRHIGKIRIHPQDPNTVFVAALGHAFGKNQERGVFKSVDGGETWKQVLFKSDKAGAIDLSIDPNNPRIMYATIWEVYRNFWQISSGGQDSGIWKSTDGGETWTDISSNKGLPPGVMGKIGIAASPAKPGRVWALIESDQRGMYRSDDYGETWEHLTDNPSLVSRAWYYMHVTPDPQDGDTVYVNNLNLWKSVDGGKTYVQVQTPHGDNHDIWIDPNNTQRMVQGNDGGACVSLNGGATWSTIYNQPTAQFYHATTDNQTPYRIYGTQQDNSSISVPSRTHNASIMWSDCYPAGTGESGYIAVNPEDSNIVYVGAIGSSPGGGNALQRYDHRTKQIRLVTTWPEIYAGEGAEKHKYRFAWTYPIFISPHDANTIYISGNLVFKSTNEGQSWEAISPDLTKADPDTLKPTGGPINRDAVGAETYATVFALAESPLEQGVLWAGSDDGLVHISRDGGANWTEITPKDLPDWTLISCIEPSRHDPATAYMAATKYKLDDYSPYLYKTTDYGQTWTRISNGIREDDFTRIIREDPEKQGLLYTGTETGVYVSFDDGANWQAFQLNLPVSPIHDLIVKENDLIAATHGRSIWILDNRKLLHKLTDDLAGKTVHLFEPPPTLRQAAPVFGRLFAGNAPGKNYMTTLGVVAAYEIETSDENVQRAHFYDSGENPPFGAVITYYLKDTPEQKIKLEVTDKAGDVIRTFTSMDDEDRKANKVDDDKPKPTYLTANPGWNRFEWDLRYEDAVRLEANDPQAGPVSGPTALPGTYQVRLTVGEDVLTQPLELVKDTTTAVSDGDLQAQFDTLLQIRDKLSEVNSTLNTMRRIRQQLDGFSTRLAEDDSTKSLAETASNLRDKVLEIEEPLMVPDLVEGWPGMLNRGIQLSRKLAGLPAVVQAGDFKPTDQAVEVFKSLSAQIGHQLEAFDQLKSGELADFEKQLKGLDHIIS